MMAVMNERAMFEDFITNRFGSLDYSDKRPTGSYYAPGVNFMWELWQVRAAIGANPAALSDAHPDNLAVDRFAVAMKAKMAAQRAKGYGGWDDPERCPVERLSRLLVEHVSKGYPVDVANFAMMLHQRGADQSVLAAAAPTGKPVAWLYYDNQGGIPTGDPCEGRSTFLSLRRGEGYFPNETPLYTHPEPAGEPVAWRIFDGEGQYLYQDNEPDEANVSWSAQYGRKFEALYLHPAPADSVLAQAVLDYLEAQDAVDNREYQSINAESYDTLMRRRNNARRDLEESLAAHDAEKGGAE